MQARQMIATHLDAKGSVDEVPIRRMLRACEVACRRCEEACRAALRGMAE